jgi:hypothetical protein
MWSLPWLAAASVPYLGFARVQFAGVTLAKLSHCQHEHEQAIGLGPSLEVARRVKRTVDQPACPRHPFRILI